ncbi:MAG TPA: hypothetical protein PLS90_13150 [Candidatus Sumerlaeota bacterium]|nr:MAG: hypothetical protein BWZ08_01100 [candidate division BRC1 bacterium ADurb.BinA292]HOE97214.1 hypothetical protein [Candidatus Sumerlaeota bacterium]HOR28961.1 hypothetical protein [Candidatus Sumerlaeota bacterium]HPK03392.1 hypothetical protein [Candidatus Sumerlaeota bacterium]
METTRIATLENEVEAALLGDILREREIPHFIQSFRDAAYDGIFQTQKGWGCVVGPPERADEVREILEDLRKQPG